MAVKEKVEKTTKLQTAAAGKAAESIAALFEDSARCQISLAYALEDFFGNAMHKHLEYETIGQCIEEEFDVSQSHVSRLRKIAYWATDLGYTQDQIVSIYARVGHLSTLANYLGSLEKKVPIKQVIDEVRDYREDRDHVQWNITMNKREAAEATKVLKAMGMKVDADSGRRMHVNTAHLAVFRAAAKTLKK